MGKRSKVATGTKRPLRRDYRQDVFVEQSEHQLKGLKADAGMPLGEGVGADDHHRAHNFGWQFRTCTDGVAEDDIFLQLLHVLRRDQTILESAKAGGDTVGNTPFADEFGDCISCPLDAGNSFGVKSDLSVGISRGFNKLGDGE